MRLFLSYRFSLEKLVAKHTIDILDANPKKYLKCRTIMERLSNNQNQSTKKQLNLIFNISNTNDILRPFHDILYRLVENSKITSQEELDKLCNWLTTEIRINNKLSEESILERLAIPKTNEQMVSHLEQILQERGKEQDISELSRQIRQLYPSVSSADIYKEVKARFVNCQKKSNKLIWDKIGGVKPRILPYETNPPDVYAEHLKITQNRLRFRFPPEPNGYLHIGHCKSIRINFQTAKRLNGMCYLRFDDTNPDTQSHEYIDNILKEVRWMGYEPDKITYASDYFPNLIQYAMQLVKQGKAYVCNTPRMEMQQERAKKLQNTDRNRPISYSEQHFPSLLPHQTLRLKLDPAATNPTLRDPVIFRNKDKPHLRTGTTYSIYPTYDFTHCISDSLQHIDYSLCSLEFEIRRQLYYLILDMLNLYKPVVWEYSRLNIDGNVLSKRKIINLVQDQVVSGWSDPRLLTISGLRNRGYSPEAINNFIDRVNVARSGNENIIRHNVLEIELKKELYKNSERTMAVLEPKILKIAGMEQTWIDVPLFPEQPEKGTRKVRICREVIVDDVLKEGDEVNLKYFKTIRIVKADNYYVGEIVKSQNQKKLKNIHWIVKEDAVNVPIMEYAQLMTGDTVNPNTCKEFKGALIPRGLDPSKTYQFERLGYYKFWDGTLICCCRL